MVNASATMAAVAVESVTAAANSAIVPTRSPYSTWPATRFDVSGIERWPPRDVHHASVASAGRLTATTAANMAASFAAMRTDVRYGSWTSNRNVPDSFS
jgi:hypothetical protein